MTAFARRLALTSTLLFAVAAAAQQKMPRDAKPTFDAVTVKLTPADEHRQGISFQGSRFVFTNQTVLSLIMFSYGVHSKQVVDAPDWIGTTRYNVSGIPSVAGEPDLAQFQYLVRQFLQDRFGLRLHTTRRDLSYYALREPAGGTKIVKSAAPPDSLPDQSGNGSAKGQMMKFTNCTMPEFALGMQYFADRPVVNETGLPDRYDFTLRWTPDSMKAPVDDAYPNLFTAMREQLGLEFKPAKGPVDVYVVDAVQAPGED